MAASEDWADPHSAQPGGADLRGGWGRPRGLADPVRKVGTEAGKVVKTRAGEGSGTIENVRVGSSNCSTIFVGGGEWEISRCCLVSDRALSSVVSCAGSSRLQVRSPWRWRTYPKSISRWCTRRSAV